jgi:hypothetical protein
MRRWSPTTLCTIMGSEWHFKKVPLVRIWRTLWSIPYQCKSVVVWFLVAHNVQVETSNKQIKIILQKIVHEIGKGWKEKLPEALWS